MSNNKKSQGTLYIISAPSGGGKTSLVAALLQTMPNLEVSISHTTRAKRPGEQDHVNYHFIDEITFKELLQKQTFLEHAKVFGNFYGTSRPWIEEKLSQGIDVILEIDWQGAEQIRRTFNNCLSIFILPPSWDLLAKRLRERAQDDEDTIARRLAEAHIEVSHYSDYDYLVINDDFERVLADLQVIIRAKRLQQGQKEIRHAQELLK